jgi:hypothetical protein
MDIMPLDLPHKDKMLLRRWHRFLAGKLHLLQYGPSFWPKIQNVPLFRLVLCVSKMSVIKAGQQAVLKNFPHC